MSTDYNLPVFCTPTELNFVIGKRDMQESKPIQIFNPYNHLIRFKFFTNAPDRWRVENTQGGIRPNNYITTTVQLRDHRRELKQPMNDVLRVEIYRENEPTAVGKKDISLNIVMMDPGEKMSGFVEFAESSFNSSSTNLQLRNNKAISNLTRRQGSAAVAASAGATVSPSSSSFYWLALFGLFACLLCLLIPIQCDNNNSQSQQAKFTFVPFWLRPSHVQHCVASYILGLLTMYFFLHVN